MPQLAKEQVERLYLPSTADVPEEDKAWVDLSIGRMLAGDVISLSDTENNLVSALRLLSGRIKGWNFTLEDGSPAPVTIDNVQKMEITDLNFLFDKLSDIADNLPALSADQKKSL